MKRRSFLAKTTFAGIGLSAIPALAAQEETKELKKIRIAFIGVGERGIGHVELCTYRDDVEIVAIADPDLERILVTQKLLKDKNRPDAIVYSNGNYDYENLLKKEKLDAVIISTPWRWHTPQAVSAMKAGVYTAVEVPAAVTLNECWELVKTHEQTGTHLMFLENVCYRRDTIAVLNMIRQGILGEMVYAHCGYQHDLRGIKFNNGNNPANSVVEFGEKASSEAKWRTLESVNRNGELYPTHGVGPVAKWFNINTGNRFKYLTSTATKARGLHNYVVEKGGANHPNANINFKLGDVITTVIQCENGENIVIMHDTNLPRPYSLGFRAQGTKGLWEDEGSRIFIEGTSPAHKWEEWKKYQLQYDHPVWKKFEKDAENAGHGGMDFFVVRAFLECVKAKIAPPIDVYDAAAWSAISELSERSIMEDGKPQEFPDFTKGKWKTNKPKFGLDDKY
jgi:hypothetical protein